MLSQTSYVPNSQDKHNASFKLCFGYPRSKIRKKIFIAHFTAVFFDFVSKSFLQVRYECMR